MISIGFDFIHVHPLNIKTDYLLVHLQFSDHPS